MQKHDPGDKLPPFAKLVGALSKRLPIGLLPYVGENDVRRLVNRLAEPYKSSETADRIVLEERIKALGERAVPALVDLVRTKCGQDRELLSTALNLLKPFHVRQIVQYIAPLVRHPQREFKEMVIRALGDIGTDDCVEPIKTSLCDPDNSVQRTAWVSVYGCLKDGRGTLGFRAHLFGPVANFFGFKKDDCSGGQVFGALFRMDRTKAVDLLVQREVLKWTGTPLNNVLKEANSCEAILPGADLKRILETTRTNLGKWPNEETFQESVIALARSGDPDAPTIISEAIESADKVISESGARGLTILKGIGDIQARFWEQFYKSGFDNFRSEEIIVMNLFVFVHEGFKRGKETAMQRGKKDLPYDQGILSYLTDDWRSRYWRRTSQDLRTIGAETAARVFDEVIAVFGPSGPLAAAGNQEIYDQLREFSDSKMNQLSALNAQFQADPDRLITRLFLYIAEHADRFRIAR